MTLNPRPTRAETSDVANAVFDGSDALYAFRRKPRLERIRWKRANDGPHLSGKRKPTTLASFARKPAQFNIAETASELICHASEELHMKVIAVFTESGFTARLVSKHRPRRPIIAFSTLQETRRRLSLYWGVVPKTIAKVQNIEELVQYTEKRLLKSTW